LRGRRRYDISFRLGDYTGKWTETLAISHNGPSDPDYFRLARNPTIDIGNRPITFYKPTSRY